MKNIVNLTILILLVSSNVFGQFPTFKHLKPGLNNDPSNLIYGSTQANHRKLKKQVHNAQLPTTCTGSWNNQSGPFGISGAYSVVTDPAGNLVLASTFSGIARSTDGGETWQYIGGFVNPWYNNGSICAIAIDPVNSNKIIAGEGTDMFMEVYISEDAGITWTMKNHPSSEMCIDISKANHNRVISGSNSFNYQLAKSYDGGYTWSSISLPSSTTGRVWTVKFHPTDQNKVFAGGEMGLFYSTDFGNTWSELNNGIPDTDYISIQSIEFSPTNTDSIVVSCSSANGPYLSSDGGTSWVSIRNNLWQNELNWDVLFPKWDSKQLLMGTLYTGLYKSQLPAENWQNVDELNSLRPGSIQDIETSINQKIFLGTRYNGVLRSTDGGSTYTNQANGLSCAETRCVKIDPSSPMKAIAVGWSGMYSTNDLGMTWQNIENSGTWLSADISKTNPNIYYACGCNPSIMKSIDGGTTWTYCTNGITGLYRSFIKIAIDPNNPDKVIALSHYGSDNTVYQTFDGGSNWQPALGIPSDAGAYSIHGIVFTPQSIFVATDNGFYKSIDNGISWSQSYPASPQSLCTTVYNDSLVLCGFSGSGIYYSSDQGSSWAVMLNSPENVEILDFKINAQNSDEIVLVNMNNDCYYTDDGGQTWLLQSDGLFCDYIYSLEVDFANKIRYAPTTTNSVFRWVDPAPAYPGYISGNTIVCKGQNFVTYTVPAIANATSYVWTLPNGATGTSTTNSISVNYGASAISGDIAVYGINSCGNGPSSELSINVDSIPVNAGTITGYSTICQGQDSVTYAVPAITNATSYVWTLPNGATGTSTTNSITVDYGTSAVSGNITVVGTNDCGNGANSSLAIIVNEKPVRPEISINGNVLQSNAPSGNQWYNNETLISGATNPSYTVSASGDYYVIVTLNDCNSEKSNIIHFSIGIEESNSIYEVSVFPNPNNGEFKIRCEFKQQKEISIKLVDYSGKSCYSFKPNKYFWKIEKSINLNGLPSGIYKLILMIDNETITKNIVIQK